MTSVLADLSATGGTDINLGVQYGIDEITRHSDGRPDIVNRVYLFSDGAPTSGETDWTKIRRNIAERVRGDLTISCFGFGSDARMRELEALAGITGGFATFVTDADDVRLNLIEDLARREHLAAINIQLRIDIDPDITVWHLYGHDLITDPATRARVERAADTSAALAREELNVESLPHLITHDKGIRIFAPDLAHGETYWIVLELQIPPGKTAFGSADVQYVDVLAKENRQHKLDLSESTIPGEIVFAHAVGLWTSEITFYALDDLYQNDRETAKNRLSNHIQLLHSASSLVPAKQFTQDQVTFRKFISLAANLGQMKSFSDHRGNDVMTYTTHAMSQFGQVRSGYLKNSYGS